jgi:hypothetical protein
LGVFFIAPPILLPPYDGIVRRSRCGSNGRARAVSLSFSLSQRVDRARRVPPGLAPLAITATVQVGRALAVLPARRAFATTATVAVDRAHCVLPAPTTATVRLDRALASTPGRTFATTASALSSCRGRPRARDHRSGDGCDAC